MGRPSLGQKEVLVSSGDATTVHLRDRATVNILIEIAESEPDNHD